MRTKNEIQQLKRELEKLTSSIVMNGTKEEIKQFTFAFFTKDAFDWVLEEIGTDEFKSDRYLDHFKLRIIASNIEYRTGKKMQNFTS